MENIRLEEKQYLPLSARNSTLTYTFYIYFISKYLDLNLYVHY